MTPAGMLYLYSAQPLAFFEKGPGSPLRRIRATGTPALTPGQVLLDDFAVDSQGTFYIPSVWRDASRAFRSGVLVFNAEGRYQRTIVFSTPVEVRHIAVDQGGDIFTLGIDSRYYRGQTTDTSVLRRFTALGDPVAAFAPQAAQPGGGGGIAAQAKRDIDRGILLMYRGMVYNVLTSSATVRTYDGGGHLGHEIVFRAPAGSNDRIWHFVPLPGGMYLIHWIHPEAAGDTVRNSPYLCVHDGSGRALAEPARQPWSQSFPLSADENGNCYFLHGLSDGTAEVVTVSIELR